MDDMNTKEELLQNAARQLLDCTAADSVEEAYVKAFIALSNAADERAQAIEDASKGDDATTTNAGRFGIIEHIVDDFGAENVMQWLKNANGGCLPEDE